ncbi:MAG: type II toxin-antitoxin system HicB family antitoxin [Candidatus Methylumidiphilus sp.]
MYNKSNQLTMIYWKNEKFWLGRLKEYPEIMTQGESLEELEENLRDAYHEMLFEDIQDNYQGKLIAV